MTSILIIEDDDLFRDALGDALDERGYTVRRARDGEEGMRLFRVAPTDLVLTDIVMPNQEGTATITELRRDFPNVGIVAMSGGLAHNSPLYLKIATAFGADRVLKKPFTVEVLLETMSAVLACRRLPANPEGPAGNSASPA